jgi:hypothetical protein
MRRLRGCRGSDSRRARSRSLGVRGRAIPLCAAPFLLELHGGVCGLAVAFPPLIVVAVYLINVGLFVYMAVDDERVLLASAMAVDYERYRMRVGMFLPRFEGKR